MSAARKKEKIDDENNENIGNISAAFDVLDNLNVHSSMLSKFTLSKVDKWISTGCYALNAIISGSLYKGIPGGRITLLAGPPASGKSYIIGNILANAQSMGMHPIIFDSEFDKDSSWAEGVGLNPNDVKYVPIESIEKITIQVAKFLDSVEKNKLHGKFIIAIDSIGNIASEKEINDALNEKSASDMGINAKLIKQFFRIMTYKAAVTQTPMIIAGHVYEDPGAFIPSTVKTVRGGSGIIYLSSVALQLSSAKNRAQSSSDKKELLPGSTDISGSKISILTTKNRFIPPFLKIENHLSFTNGLDPYSGLVDIAVEFGILSMEGNSYYFNNEKIGFESALLKNYSLWKEKIMPELEKKINEHYKYGGNVKIGENGEISDDVAAISQISNL